MRARDIMTRLLHALALAAVFAALHATALTAAAGAHAQLSGTEPGAGATVQDAPRDVVLTFDEPVNLELGGVKVYGPDGERIDAGDAAASDTEIRVALEAGAEESGSYAVSWRAVSADGHPIRGAFLYNLREASDSTALDKAEAESSTSQALDAAFSIARGAYLLGLLVAAGGMLLAVWIAPGWRARWIVPALLVTIAASVAGFLLDAGIAGGYGLGETFDPDVLAGQASTVYGRAALVRIAVAVVLLAAVAARRRASNRALDHVTGAIAVALAAAQSLSGHAMAAEDDIWLRLPLDMVHMVAAAAWVGGVAQLALRPASSTTPLHATVRRYSFVALASVTTLVLTGLYAAWDEIGFSTQGLLETTYGRLVLAKSALLVATLPLANRNRVRHVPQMAEDRDGGWAALRRYVRGELAILVVVVAATAWLVQSVPARNELAPPFQERTAELRGGGSMQLVIDPARAGSNEAHIYVFTEQGQPDDALTAATLTGSLEDPQLGPLVFEGTPSGPGHFVFRGAQLPYAGEWQLSASVKRGRFEEERQEFDLRVASAEDA